MTGINITFGTIKKSQRDTSGHVKYADKAVVTVEGVKGDNKTRRVLFNAKAMEVLNLPAGASQNIIFGFIEADELGNRRLLIANADMLENKAQTVVYNTSKNKVSFEESKEKGKAIGNAGLHKELNTFLEINEMISHEYELKHFGINEGLDLYEFKKIVSEADNQSINDYTKNPLEMDQEHLADIADDEVEVSTQDDSAFNYHEADVQDSSTQPEWN